jgi:hypothetical protein
MNDYNGYINFINELNSLNPLNHLNVLHDMNDDMNVIKDDMLLHEFVHQAPAERGLLAQERLDPFDENDDNFYKNYRFCKESVRRIGNLFYPEGENVNDRGFPLTSEQVDKRNGTFAIFL